MNRVLAIIPARAGSKRLPQKNIKLLADKPLIAWTIEFAKKLHNVSHVLVSTDCLHISEVALEYGADVPWMRPKYLASDESGTSSVIEHAVKELGKVGRVFDYIIVLQPTSPFRDLQMVSDAIECCIKNNGIPIVSICEAKSNPEWCYKENAKGKFISYLDGPEPLRHQDLQPLYDANGNFFIIGTDNFMKYGTFFYPEFIGVKSNSRKMDIDIDDEFDWFIAEKIMNERSLIE